MSDDVICMLMNVYECVICVFICTYNYWLCDRHVYEFYNWSDAVVLYIITWMKSNHSFTAAVLLMLCLLMPFVYHAIMTSVMVPIFNFLQDTFEKSITVLKRVITHIYLCYFLKLPLTLLSFISWSKLVWLMSVNF